MQIVDKNDVPIDDCNPIPVDTTRVYQNQIDYDNAVVNNFVSTEWGESPQDGIRNLFIAGTTWITNTSGDNPKVLEIPVFFDVVTAVMTMRTATGNFSNTKIEYISVDGSVNKTFDESSDNTDKTTILFDHTVSWYATLKLTFATADPVTITRINSITSQDVIAKILAVSVVDESIESIASFKQSILVESGLNHEGGINKPFTFETGDNTTLNGPVSAEDTSIIVVDGSIYAVGNLIIVEDNGLTELFPFHITNIVTNTLTLDRPLDSDHASGVDVKEVITNMNVVGTLAAPISFKVQPEAGETWQITRELISITDAGAMDDGKFGSLNSLTNGVDARLFRGGEFFTGSIWKNNGDMVLDMFDITYTDRAPGGENGLRGRWTFTRGEFIIELDGDLGDYMELLIQDDLSDLTSFQVKVQGRDKFN